MSEGKITIKELQGLFGDELPIEAISILQNENGRDIEEVRGELQRIARDPVSVMAWAVARHNGVHPNEYASLAPSYREDMRAALRALREARYAVVALAEAVAQQKGAASEDGEK